jgi:hypothetical protein
MLADPNTPASAVTARMRVDAKFREAIESEGRAPTPVAPKVSLDQIAEAEPADYERILRFARDWEKSPRILPLVGGYRTTASGDRFTAEQFERNLEFVSSHHLIRQ